MTDQVGLSRMSPGRVVSGGEAFQFGGSTGISPGPNAGTSAAENRGNTISPGVADDFATPPERVAQPVTKHMRLIPATATGTRFRARIFEVRLTFMVEVGCGDE